MLFSLIGRVEMFECLYLFVRISKEEEERGGLVIVAAFYGVLVRQFPVSGLASHVFSPFKPAWVRDS
jgi:hypothetical protein